MAQNASDSQKVDYLWKKIVYGAAKTDISGNIDATNEPNPSPLQIRADRILQNSDQIPGVIPGSNTSVVTVYTTSLPIECTSTAGIPTPILTWQTGQTFWVPPEFGSTYQVKVYIGPSGQAGNVLTKGTQVFATGTGNNDLWVFDYQSGILNFNSNNTPYNGASPISFTGNSVYISGAVYSGAFGLPNNSDIGNLLLGNIQFDNTTITTVTNNANIYLTTQGTGAVQVTGTGAIGIPAGSTSDRPNNPSTGYTRLNTDDQQLEFWTGTGWTSPGTAIITSDIIDPDGVSNVYVLSSNATTTGIMVSINGTLQQPTTAYTIVNNNQIQFTEVPVEADVIEVRHLVVGAGVLSASQLQVGPTSVILDSATVTITGNTIPSETTVYSLGSASAEWQNIYTGNIYVSEYIIGNGSKLSSLPGYAYSNVNVASYITNNGLTNYSNVNVAAYTTSQSYTNYSNVNVAAYLTTYTGNLGAGNVNATNLYGTIQTISQPNIVSLGTLTGITLNGSQVNTNINTPVSANTTVAIDSYNKTIYRTAKYIIQSTSNTDVESYEALVIHNNANSTQITIYGVINTGNSLGNLAANIIGNTVNINYTAYSASANVRISKNYIVI